jgi:hypothetical protein
MILPLSSSLERGLDFCLGSGKPQDEDVVREVIEENSSNENG